MSRISTHVLDAVLGKPAAGIAIRLEAARDGGSIVIAEGATDADGRCRDFAPDAPKGIYRITFATGDYLKSKNRASIYPEVTITFQCDGETHYHLPLLLSDNSYTTYRGS
jgi:5-hydroxyisourate hydrolase